jgi:alpha-N-acetylglucosamine transferase
MVIDQHVWLHAAVLLQQLLDVQTILPIVTYLVSPLPEYASEMLKALGAQVQPLEPAMVVPAAFNSKKLALPFARAGKPVLSRISPWQKLGVWGQTRWDRIILLDVDILLLGNIDEMAQFPANTFGPEACRRPEPGRCASIPTISVSGFNAGVIVVGPSEQTFASMAEFATNEIGGRLSAAPNASVMQKIERDWLFYPEQSFLKRFWPAVMRADLQAPHKSRQGYDWQWSTRLDSRCESDYDPRVCPPVELLNATHFMSLLYNARPHDCAYCSDDFMKKAKIIHFTCCTKPWAGTRARWEQCASGGCRSNTLPANEDYAGHPCVANLTIQWLRVRDRVCEHLQRTTRARNASAWPEVSAASRGCSL